MLSAPGTRNYRVESVVRPRFVPGLLAVRVEDDVVAQVPAETTPRPVRGAMLPDALEGPLGMARRARQIRGISAPYVDLPGGLRLPASATGLAQALAASVRQVIPGLPAGVGLLHMSASADVAALARELRQARGVVYAESVPARWAATSPRPRADPRVNRQWALRAIRWFELDEVPDASDVHVAVLDSGVDQDHRQLGSIVAYDHAGRSAEDIIGHGTHVAGIIGAQPGDADGVYGVAAPRLSVWKIFDDAPAADDEYYVDFERYQEALRAALKAGAAVINLSIVGTERSDAEEDLFQSIADSGTVVVAAAGNEYADGNPVGYPAAYPSVVAVGASTETDRRADFSCTGEHVALLAPGTNVLSTLPTTTSAYRSTVATVMAAWPGTSMAVPHVSAAVALLRAREPKLDAEAIRAKLRSTARKVAEMQGRDTTPEHGSGILDVKSLLAGRTT